METRPLPQPLRPAHRNPESRQRVVERYSSAFLIRSPQSAIRNRKDHPHRRQLFSQKRQNRPYRGNAHSPYPCHINLMKIESFVLSGSASRPVALLPIRPPCPIRPISPTSSLILSYLPLPRISIIPWLKTAFPQSVFLPTGKHQVASGSIRKHKKSPALSSLQSLPFLPTRKVAEGCGRLRKVKKFHAAIPPRPPEPWRRGNPPLFRPHFR